MNSIRSYIEIMRPDNWFKNIFIIPGILFACLFIHPSIDQIWWKIVVGLMGTCFIASANYVINEWLDAEFDRFHPEKKFRPSATGKMQSKWIYTEYVILIVLGMSLSSMISVPFLLCSIMLLVMGVLYNVRPFRTKEKPYLDVLSESINNPIRLLLGWFIVTSQYLPPASLIIGYWMGGIFNGTKAICRTSFYR